MKATVYFINRFMMYLSNNMVYIISVGFKTEYCPLVRTATIGFMSHRTDREDKRETEANYCYISINEKLGPKSKCDWILLPTKPLILSFDASSVPISPMSNTSTMNHRTK